MSSDVKIWQQVLDFKMKTDGDGEITLSDLKGRPVVLYFYPKDDTSGCTKEAYRNYGTIAGVSNA